MIRNRSIPGAIVIPELSYPDVMEAADWLCAAFGFTLRLRIANHRAQLCFGDGAVIVTELSSGFSVNHAHSVMVRVEDVDFHYQRAHRHGASILRPPADYPYGERQYSAVDPAGHRWTFSQSIADIDPADWGGTPGV